MTSNIFYKIQTILWSVFSLCCLQNSITYVHECTCLYHRRSWRGGLQPPQPKCWGGRAPPKLHPPKLYFVFLLYLFYFISALKPKNFPRLRRVPSPCFILFKNIIRAAKIRLFQRVLITSHSPQILKRVFTGFSILLRVISILPIGLYARGPLYPALEFLANCELFWMLWGKYF